MSNSSVCSLQMEELKINVLPPIEGSPVIYPAEKPHDAASVLTWLKQTIGPGTLAKRMGSFTQAILSSPMCLLDAGEYDYRVVPKSEEGERHIAQLCDTLAGPQSSSLA